MDSQTYQNAPVGQVVPVLASELARMCKISVPIGVFVLPTYKRSSSEFSEKSFRFVVH